MTRYNLDRPTDLDKWHRYGDPWAPFKITRTHNGDDEMTSVTTAEPGAAGVAGKLFDLTWPDMIYYSGDAITDGPGLDWLHVKSFEASEYLSPGLLRSLETGVYCCVIEENIACDGSCDECSDCDECLCDRTRGWALVKLDGEL